MTTTIRKAQNASRSFGEFGRERRASATYLVEVDGEPVAQIRNLSRGGYRERAHWIVELAHGRPCGLGFSSRYLAEVEEWVRGPEFVGACAAQSVFQVARFFAGWR